VPKYESNERFSCMITTTCWILWIPVSPGGVRRGGSVAVVADVVLEAELELVDARREPPPHPATIRAIPVKQTRTIRRRLTGAGRVRGWHATGGD
jgi:hypothetical protein